MAALSTAIAVGALALAGASTASTLAQKKPKSPALPDAATLLSSAPKATPEADARVAQQSASEARRRKAGGGSGRASTILTGASGASGEPATQRKTLLGY